MNSKAFVRLSGQSFRLFAVFLFCAIDSTPWVWAASDTVNPGDQLNVTVFNHPELSEQLKVDSRGGISLPLAGYVTVAGLGLRAIDAKITAKLAPYLKIPAVDVQSIGESQSVFVAGGPGGVLPFSPGETLSTALADVEKNLVNRDPQENNRIVFTDEIDHSRIDLHRVGIDRSGKVIGVYDTVAMRRTGDPGPVLHANDTVVFQDKPIQVFVTGEVAKPGEMYLDPSEPLSDAIEEAGGSLPQAAPSHIIVTTAESKRVLTLGDPVFGAPASPDEKVYVPVAPRVQVNGLVAKPGQVFLQTDFTLLGAINSAGGINRFANIKDVQVTYSGKSEPQSYDITKLTFGDMSQNPVLKDGDSVFVPEGHKIDFTTVFAALAGFRDVAPYNF